MLDGNTVVFKRALEILTDLEDIRLVNGQQNLVVDGKTFVSNYFTIGDREEKADSSVNSINVTISNGDSYYSNLIANNGDVFTGATILIYYYAEETLVEEFKGVIESIQMSANTFEITINETLNFKDKVPILTFSSTCNFKFKGKVCKYAGSDTYCSHTYDACKAKGNQKNFGGFPATALIKNDDLISS